MQQQVLKSSLMRVRAMIKRTLAFAAGVAVIAASAFLLPNFNLTVGDAPKAPKLSVEALDLQLICPGGAINSGGANGTTVGNFGHIGAAAISGSNGADTKVTFANLSNFNGINDLLIGQRNVAGVFSWQSASGSKVVAQSGSQEQGSNMLNGAQLQKVASARMNGLLATACQAPSPEHWLVGGSAATGRETLLILANPSTVAITVSLEVFAEGGQVSAAGLSGISIAANSQTIVPLSSLIPETKTFAIHVVSSSGAVASWLQQRTVRGLLYAGADYVAPATTFAKSLVIPGVLIRGSADAAALIAANADYSDLKPVLRVFNPSDSKTTFTAQLNGATATTFGTVVHDSVLPHSVQDFEITGLANGDYSAFISADQNITASIRLVRTDKAKKPNTDFTWLQAAETFTGSRTFTVPATGISKLTIANPSTKTASVSVNGVAYSIAANSMVVLKADNSKSINIVSNDVAVGANLVVDVDGQVANIALVNYKNLGSEVRVRVR